MSTDNKCYVPLCSKSHRTTDGPNLVESRAVKAQDYNLLISHRSILAESSNSRFGFNPEQIKNTIYILYIIQQYLMFTVDEPRASWAGVNKTI